MEQHDMKWDNLVILNKYLSIGQHEWADKLMNIWMQQFRFLLKVAAKKKKKKKKKIKQLETLNLVEERWLSTFVARNIHAIKVLLLMINIGSN